VAGRSVKVAAYVAAVVIFVLAGFGVHVSDLGELDLVAFGLAVFALAHVVP
jgi:hypothetical protein